MQYSEFVYWSLEPTASLPIEHLKLLPSICQVIEQNCLEGEPTYLVEINGLYKSTPENPKPSQINGGKSSLLGIDGAYWVTASVTLSALTKLISEGFCIRLGVKNGGTDYSNSFVSTDFIYLDVDKDQTVDESIGYFSHYASVIYGTPSYTESNQKHRVVIRLSKTLTNWQKVKALLIYFHKTFEKLDKSCIDPARVMYGSFGNIFYTSDTARLDVDSVFSDPDYQKILKSLENSGIKGLENQVANKYHTPIISYLANKCDGDINILLQKIGLEFPFDFKEIKADFNGRKWEGSNPFSATNSSGKSLVCSLKDGKILFYDRSVTNQDHHSRNGASIFGFVECLKQGYSSLSDDCMDKERFKYVIADIFRALEFTEEESNPDIYWIDPSNGKKRLKDLTEILRAYIFPELEGKLYRCSNKTEESVNGFIYYIYEAEKWSVTSNIENVKTLIQDTFYNFFGQAMNDAYCSKLKPNIINQMPPSMILYEAPKTSKNHVFFANGAFNLKTKELEPYTPELWHFTKLEYDYRTPSRKSLSKIFKGFRTAELSREDRRILINSFILTIHKRFHLLGRFLYLYGKSSTGKTTTARVFANALGYDYVSAQTVAQKPEYIGKYFKQVTVLDEVKNLTRIVPEIASNVRNFDEYGNTFIYNDKNEKAFLKVVPITMILTGESFSMGESTKNDNVDGIKNRLISIEFNNPQPNGDNIWRQISRDKESIRDLVRFAVNVQESCLEKIHKFFDSIFDKGSEQNERAEEFMKSSDPIYELLDHFEVDPKWNGQARFGYTQCFSFEEIVSYYRTITGDDSIKTTVERKRLINRFLNVFQEKYPLVKKAKVRLKSGEEGESYKIYGVVYKKDEIV